MTLVESGNEEREYRSLNLLHKKDDDIAQGLITTPVLMDSKHYQAIKSAHASNSPEKMKDYVLLTGKDQHLQVTESQMLYYWKENPYDNNPDDDIEQPMMKFAVVRTTFNGTEKSITSKIKTELEVTKSIVVVGISRDNNLVEDFESNHKELTAIPFGQLDFPNGGGFKIRPFQNLKVALPYKIKDSPDIWKDFKEYDKRIDLILKPVDDYRIDATYMMDDKWLDVELDILLNIQLQNPNNTQLIRAALNKFKIAAIKRFRKTPTLADDYVVVTSFTSSDNNQKWFRGLAKYNLN